jgi:hypothetical protein
MAYNRLRKLGLSWQAQQALEQAQRQNYDPSWAQPTPEEAQMLAQNPGLPPPGEPVFTGYGIRAEPEPEAGAARLAPLPSRKPRWHGANANRYRELVNATQALSRQVEMMAAEGGADPKIQQLARSMARAANSARIAAGNNVDASKYVRTVANNGTAIQQYLATNPTPPTDNPYGNIYDAAAEGLSAVDTAIENLGKEGYVSGYGENVLTQDELHQGGGYVKYPGQRSVEFNKMERFPETGVGRGAVPSAMGPIGQVRPAPGKADVIVGPETGGARTPVPSPRSGQVGSSVGITDPGAAQRTKAYQDAMRAAEQAALQAGNDRTIAQQAREAEQRRQQAARGGRVASLRQDRMLKRAYAFKKLISVVKK